MKTRQLGNSNLRVPPIIYGAWAIGGWYWGGTDDEAAVRAISRSNRSRNNGDRYRATCTDSDTAKKSSDAQIRGRRAAVQVLTKCACAGNS